MKTKRFLAFLLTILMIGGMLPTVFAEDATEESTGVTLVYDFACTVLVNKNGASNGTTTVRDGAVKNYTVDSKLSDPWTYVAQYGLFAAAFQDNGLFIYTKTKEVEENSNAVVFTINVPASGTYSAQVSDHRIYSYTDKTDVYLVSKTVAATNGWGTTPTLANVQSAIAVASMDEPTASVKHIASFEAYPNPTVADKLAENVYLPAGDYYMLVTLNEGSNPDEHASNSYAMLRKLTLTSEDAAPALAPVVYSFIAEAKNGYTSGDVDMTTVTSYDMLNSDVSTGAWMYYNKIGMDAQLMYAEADHGTTFRAVTSTFGTSDNAIILKAELENSGIYKPSMLYATYQHYGRLDVYFVPVSYADSKWSMKSASLNIADVLADSEVKRIASQDGWVASGSSAKVPGEYDNVYLDSGEYYVIINLVQGTGVSTHNWATYFKTTGLTLAPQAGVVLSAPSSTVKVGKTMTLSADVANEAGKIIPADIVYTSSDSSIALVNNSGVVTGVAKGDATIQVTATVGGVKYTDSVVITVEPDYSVVSLATANNVNSNIAINGKYARGAKISISADEIPNHTFRHWVRGTEKNGEVVSIEPNFTYELITNTYLTAVYTENTEANTVDFFNGNGEYITTAEVVDGAVTAPAEPKLTGFKFLNWYTAKNKLLSETILDAAITRAVAVFGDTDDTYTVAGEENLKYDAKITKTYSEPVVWYRDDVRVGYGTTYEYYVWDNVEKITYVEGTAQPLVVLDKTVKDGNARMIEYDAGGKNIVEVGILFGDSAGGTVDSCEYKAVSKKSANHGQFTAKPYGDESYARGYMIYEEDGEYKVIYSD